MSDEELAALSRAAQMAVQQLNTQLNAANKEGLLVRIDIVETYVIGVQDKVKQVQVALFKEV